MELSKDEKKELQGMLNKSVGDSGMTVFRIMEELIPLEWRDPDSHKAFERSIGEEFVTLDGDVLNERDYQTLLEGMRLINEWAEKGKVARPQETKFEKCIEKARKSLVKAIISLSESQSNEAKTLSTRWAHNHAQNVMVKQMRSLGMREAGQENTLESEEMHTRNNSKMLFTRALDNVTACSTMLDIFDRALDILKRKRRISPQFG